MILLTLAQQKSLRAITHDLMLLSACSGSTVSGVVCGILGELYSGLLSASEEETTQAADYASEQIKAAFELDCTQTGVH